MKDWVKCVLLCVTWTIYLVVSFAAIGYSPLSEEAKALVGLGAFGVGWAVLLYAAHKMFPPEEPTICVISRMLLEAIERKEQNT
jgi:hypothetical protein